MENVSQRTLICVAVSSDCISDTTKFCEDCDNGLTSSNCDFKIQTNDHCKYYKTEYVNEKFYIQCLQCQDDYYYDNTNCVSTDEYIKYINKNGVIFSCEKDEFLDINNLCQKVSSKASNTQKAIFYNNIIVSLLCEENAILNISSSTCVPLERCEKITPNECISCGQNSMLKNSLCTNCTEDINCLNFTYCTCNLCKPDYLLNNGKCSPQESLNCLLSDGKSCLLCNENYKKTISEKTEFCVSLNNNEKHVKYTSNSEKVLECSSGFYLAQNSCVDLKQTVSYLNNTFKYNLNVKKDEVNHCEYHSSKGCLSCVSGYYLNTSLTCVECPVTCKSCFNSSYCLTCKSGMFLNAQFECEESTDLQNRCDQMIPSNLGCPICTSGYYKDGLDCTQCDVSCTQCLNMKTCLSCSENYFKTIYDTGLCQPYANLLNCETKNSFGCSKCAAGYYLTAVQFCEKCMTNCTSCDTQDKCNLCATNFVLINSICKSFDEIEKCKSAENNKCNSCETDFKVSDDGLSCVKISKTALAISLPLIATLFIIFFVVFIILLVLFLREKNHKNQLEKSICVFDMKKSNVLFKNISSLICTNKEALVFENESEISPEIDVAEESRSLLCVGNHSKNTLKIQFTSQSENSDVYTLTSLPQIVLLKPNFACEFEMFLTPNCTSKIDDKIAIVVLDYETGKEEIDYLKLQAVTKCTSRLDHHEIVSESKLGEGSFGVVFKGMYRGSEVAIKRLKDTGENFEESSLEEFENEIKMLDKFRSEYIVHFYGAILLPRKLAIVTKYAKYGSLRDLMKNERYIAQKSCESQELQHSQQSQKFCESQEIVTKSMRLKFLTDSAKGILYLHENGILHRDIKPDNMLIFSLKKDILVNAKLTDFGSARNVNLLMTNMTFTKGVGTPIYMAPEVLNQEKYKEAADVFSFGVSMFEVCGWCEAYPKESFQFPWKVAEFVSGGRRLAQSSRITDDEYEIIKSCWAHKTQDRPTMKEVVEVKLIIRKSPIKRISLLKNVLTNQN
ncbi:protein serine/threonine kinase, putative [Entamoeba invadens IP1]|uniref:Protein serine/threonine kinase, putative n=1 Tax=Entamoeba invadens IP1 TaxID=370355 RepID=A0A0A1U9S9_ENTIV|nr:protein serine/threonine kinase, putative [Entamoeba invadens IP1]ELP91761.1 protein serine/threonine kinase, putative [Entamoeba invadens IP1]|eukprot:XP_004258532.1 protein serine/threonine kinase, putative [Entamoeba invadens IP1]